MATQGRQEVGTDRSTPRTFAEEGDERRVTAERANVVADPLHGQDLVVHAHVAWQCCQPVRWQHSTPVAQPTLRPANYSSPFTLVDTARLSFWSTQRRMLASTWLAFICIAHGPSTRRCLLFFCVARQLPKLWQIGIGKDIRGQVVTKSLFILYTRP